MLAYALSIFKVTAVLRLIRVKQWVKNLFLFIPLFFAGLLFDYNALISLISGFLSFSLAASAVYIINDYNDLAADKIHPVKCHRPLASGEISIPYALTLMLVLASAALIMAWFENPVFFAILAGYITINLAYSYGLKNVALLDLFIIAFGFMLRVLAGGVLAGVAISKWLVIMVFLLALFLALAKRRDDLILFKKSGQQMRKSVAHYNLEFLASCLTLISGIIMVAYIMYTVSDDVIQRLGTENLYLTSVFVIAGMMRYLQITLVENNSGSPTRILYRDNFIRFVILGWIICFYIILYLPRL
jgi:decaprenyl-phosphate phosphoribosyltransferase